MKLLRIIGHLLIIALLTLITQVGGLIWLLVFGLMAWLKPQSKGWHRARIFLAVYLLAATLLIPALASLSGRKALPLSKSGNLAPRSYFYPLCNRHYVKPALYEELQIIAEQYQSLYPGMKVSYLDAGFPFIEGLSLPPHLSHKDGKKVDLSFAYTRGGEPVNLKPSHSGYGRFAAPEKGEVNKTTQCKNAGHSQYDYNKYMSFGGRSDLAFDPDRTRKLLELIIKRQKTQKVFIEPHLVTRLNIPHPKIRFQGCRAVRHDDHIHYQIW